MVKVLVLGATGFIGGHIAKEAHQIGWEVHGFRRNPSSQGHLGTLPIHWHQGNLEDYSSLLKAMTGMDFVFHAAASYPGDGNPSLVKDHIEAGVKQMTDILRAVREAQVKRLIYTSSLTTVGAPPAGEERLADERDFYQMGSLPDNGYHETKSAMENLALAAAGADLDLVILNPSLVLGPGDSHLSTGEIVVAIAKGFGIALPSAVFNIIDVRDTAAAHVKAAISGKTGQRYILGGDNYTLKEAAGTIATAAGVNPPRFTLPNWIVDLYIKVADFIPFIPFPPDHLRAYKTWQGYNTIKARQELDLHTRSLEETARDSIDWFKEHGYL